MGTVEQSKSGGLERERKKREDMIWAASLCAVAAGGLALVLGPDPFILKVAIALVLAGLFGFGGARISERAK